MAISQRSGVGPYDASRVVNVLGEVVSRSSRERKNRVLAKTWEDFEEDTMQTAWNQLSDGQGHAGPSMQIPSIKWSKMLKGALRD